MSMSGFSLELSFVNSIKPTEGDCLELHQSA